LFRVFRLLSGLIGSRRVSGELRRVEIHLAKAAGRITLGLVVEMFRLRIAAFAAGGYRFCADRLAEFDDGDEAVSVAAIDLFRARVAARSV